MTRPRAIVIGHLRYRVDYLEEEQWLEEYSDNQGGSSDHNSAHIVIRLSADGTKANEQNIRETLLHEVWHSVLAVTGVNHHMNRLRPDDREEMLVECTTPMWLTVLQDNPDLVTYLTTDQG